MLDDYKDLIKELKNEYSAESTADIYRNEKYTYQTFFKKNAYKTIFFLSLLVFIISILRMSQLLILISVISMIWSATRYYINVTYDEGAIEGVNGSYPRAQIQYKLALLENKETQTLVVSSLASDLDYLEYSKSKERQEFRSLLLKLALESHNIKL